MILVVNLNASLDKKYNLADFAKGQVVRARSVQNTPGGKGLHVANVATILGEDCVATGLLGGKTGAFIADALQVYGIRQDFVQIQGETRSCLAIITDDGAQTEILEPGPMVSRDEQTVFLSKYEELLKQAEIVVASGSVPQGVGDDFYAGLIETARRHGRRFLLDTSRNLLACGIEARPFFIKPNTDEIAALTGHTVASDADVIREVRSFMQAGIGLAVVSRGAAGSIAGFGGKIYKVQVPKIQAVNPVGSGDSYVAGTAVALQRGLNIIDTLKLAAACGTANAMEAESGFVQKQTVESLLDQIKVEEIG